MSSSLRAVSSAVILSAMIVVPPAWAQTSAQDAPPVDPRQMLTVLKQLSDVQTTQVKTRLAHAYQEAQAAAGNSAKAAELWEESVRVTQFTGLSKDAAQYRDWKEKDGDTFKEKEVQSALHLYFNWLALTLQRASGSTNKDLFNAVLLHVHDAQADAVMMDYFSDALKKEKEAAGTEKPGGPRRQPNPRDRKERNNDEAVKRMHDQILGGSVANGAYAQATKITDLVSDLAPARRVGRNGGGNGAAPGNTDAVNQDWEGQASNIDGIYMKILLPEMRSRRDLRAVEYWDAKLRREADLATMNRLSFNVDKFNQVRRPELMWNRAQEYNLLGLKNRAEGEMFAVIKANPTHPDAASWIAELTNLLSPSPNTNLGTATPSAAPTVRPVSTVPAAPAATDAIPGSVLPPGTIPGAAPDAPK